jgi:hypothetical protein
MTAKEVSVVRNWSRLVPRMGWTIALLFGGLLVAGIFYIRDAKEQIKSRSRAFKATHSLPAFSVVGPGDIAEANISPRPLDAVSKFSKDYVLVNVNSLHAGDIILRSQVVSLGVRTDLDLLAVLTSTAVAAQPGDEILLIGVREQDKSENLGPAVFLGTLDEQIVVALCHDTALRVAPFNARNRDMMAVRRLTYGKSKPADFISSRQMGQPLLHWLPCEPSNAQASSDKKATLPSSQQ